MIVTQRLSFTKTSIERRQRREESRVQGPIQRESSPGNFVQQPAMGPPGQEQTGAGCRTPGEEQEAWPQ